MTLRHLAMLLIGVLCLALLTGCRRAQRTAYYRSAHPDPRGWDIDRPLNFDTDSASAPLLEPGDYQVWLIIRHTVEYPYSNIFLTIDEVSYRSQQRREMEIDLTGANGPAGIKVTRRKALTEVAVPLGHRYVDRSWQISVGHDMDVSLLRGINDIGVKLVR